MIDECLKSLRKAGIETQRISLRDYTIRPCNACEICYTKSWKCPIKDDATQVMKKMVAADGILIGSSVFGADVTAQLKALLDRSVITYINQDLRNKVGGAITVGGGSHGGQEYAIIQLLSFFAFQGMIVASPKGGLFGAMGTANNRGDIRKDKEGLNAASELGARMAELMRMINR